MSKVKILEEELKKANSLEIKQEYFRPYKEEYEKEIQQLNDKILQLQEQIEEMGRG